MYTDRHSKHDLFIFFIDLCFLYTKLVLNSTRCLDWCWPGAAANHAQLIKVYLEFQRRLSSFKSFPFEWCFWKFRVVSRLRLTRCSSYLPHTTDQRNPRVLQFFFPSAQHELLNSVSSWIGCPSRDVVEAGEGLLWVMKKSWFSNLLESYSLFWTSPSQWALDLFFKLINN